MMNLVTDCSRSGLAAAPATVPLFFGYNHPSVIILTAIVFVQLLTILFLFLLWLPHCTKHWPSSAVLWIEQTSYGGHKPLACPLALVPSSPQELLSRCYMTGSCTVARGVTIWIPFICLPCGWQLVLEFFPLWGETQTLMFVSSCVWSKDVSQTKKRWTWCQLWTQKCLINHVQRGDESLNNTCMPVTDLRTLHIMCFLTLENRCCQLPVKATCVKVSIKSRNSVTANREPSYVTRSSTYRDETKRKETAIFIAI